MLQQPLLALWPRTPSRSEEDDVLDSLETALALVAAWCRRAIAAAWDSGRISAPNSAVLPFEREVDAILTSTTGRASKQLVQAEQAQHAVEARHRLRARIESPATRSPIGEIAAELGLSELATDILLVVAAPRLWGELARTYAILANDPCRPVCDELLVAQILGPRHASRREIARALDDDMPLRRHGLIDVGVGERPFAALTVPDTLVRRLWGDRFGADETQGAVRARAADRSLVHFWGPSETIAQIVLALRRPFAEIPLRLVLRGRLGVGRRTLLAALAEAAGRRLGVIDLSAVLADKRGGLDRLRTHLRDATLRGWLPCICVSESLDGEDATKREQLRAVLRDHAGPLTFRCPPGLTPPLDPGYLAFALPTPTEGTRAEVWRAALRAQQWPVELADGLAARYNIGPGTIARIVRQVEPAPAHEQDVAAEIQSAIRQYRETRIGSVATRVSRLATWSNVVLPPDLVDSLREFIGRVRHRRTVFERWGFDAMVTSARGLTALFQGGPGTGKSMVAGIIARELGYELYRVDLASVLSKWIGETEKNLGAVFDAAEEGEVVLLFDEADSLFSKRTEVKTSVDRYSNMEVNYLLQRLDAFEGVAILTTNFGASVDNAFKRRLSLRLSFPFPDEEMRRELWRVHLPAELPTEGDLGLADLASKYQLSGGYIRNAALRAAFLAAQDDRPLTREHLERAVKLEYRETGKLVEGGVLD
jgi:hypothetical protein